MDLTVPTLTNRCVGGVRALCAICSRRGQRDSLGGYFAVVTFAPPMARQTFSADMGMSM